MNKSTHQEPDALETKTAKILSRITAFQAQEQRVFASSSFQTQSLPLLHLLSRLSVPVPVVFVNTGYLFPETLEFRDQIVDQLGLTLIEGRPAVSKSEQRDAEGRLLFLSDPDRCCQLNKTAPMEALLGRFDVWISGVRADQSGVRKQLQSEQPGPNGILRYHPMLDWTARDVHVYRQRYQLPEHPLEAQGLVSVGCMPCTVALTQAQADGRAGRWYGRAKTECGLHTDLAQSEGAAR